MKIEKIKSILDNHGVPNYIFDGRIYADSMISFPVAEIEDLTDFTKFELYAWLGY